ncbi:phage tail protein [Paenibacillus sp. P22]|uniref:phage tail sheath family protein n=1 Tax=Paenibacillus sp. P22 TaxID=483908 RepID=UPI0004327A2B|nr:phage tail protein [Paenibacillus sp. P22]CDN41457.1 Phage tail sheath protein FI [Paenibacillus sp. P22]
MERHGIYTSEIKTTVLGNSSQTIPVIWGTAPVHLATRTPAAVNVPVLCRTYEEAVAAFGYSEDWAAYTLSEYIYAHFKLYKLAEVIIINVLDPAVHKATTAPANVTFSNGSATLPDAGVLKAGLLVKSVDGATTYVLGTDYTLGYNSAGKLVITIRSGGAIAPNTTTLKVGFDKLAPASVTAAEIIGGADSTTGTATGLELVNQIFPRFGIVPGILGAPGFSKDPTVAALIAAKGESINGLFKAMAAVDLPVHSIAQYLDAPTWAATNNYTSARQIVGFPNLTKEGKTYRFSTHLICVAARTDTAYNGIPYKSPSNEQLEVDGASGKDGVAFFLGTDQAEYLNAQGIVTAINFIGGWRAWGNRTAAFPGNTDPKDAFIPIRRMFDWLQNQVILRYWSRIDSPLTLRLIETLTDDINIWLNGLQGMGALLGGRVEFLAAENPLESLLNGKFAFHLYATPPGPAQEMNVKIEYDTQYLAAIAG